MFEDLFWRCGVSTTARMYGFGLGEKRMLFVDVSGTAAAGVLDDDRGGTRFSPSESNAKSESRAKRTSDSKRKNGVGGVFGGFWGEAFTVEGTVEGTVVLVGKRWEFRKQLVVIWMDRQV